MFKASNRIRLVVAGLLLALTAFAIGITMSVAFSANASAPTSTASKVEANTTGLDNWAGAPAQNLDMPPSPSDMEDMADMMGDPANFMLDFAAMPEQFFSQTVTGTRSMGNSPTVAGTVSKLDGDKILLNKDRVTVNTNAQTVYGDANGTLNKGDIKVNDRLIALGKNENSAYTARWVLRLPALPDIKRGTVSSVTAGSNQFKLKVGTDEFTVTTTANTEISKNGNKAALTDLAANDNAIVSGKLDSAAKTIEAQRVVVGHPQKPQMPKMGAGNRGTVKSVDAANNTLVITAKVNNADTDVTVKVDSATKFAGNNLKSLSDLKAGENVVIVGEKQSDNSIKATAIARMPNGNGGPRGNGFGGPGNGGFGPGRGNQQQPPTSDNSN